MVQDKTRLQNRLIACLKEYYPQALTLFESFDSEIALAFLLAFADPAALASTSQKQFAAFFQKHRYSRPERVSALFEKSRMPAPKADPVISRAGRMRMLALLDLLKTLRALVRDYERQIQKLFKELNDHQNLPTLPGIGDRLAPELAATLGPRPDSGPHQFATRQHLERLAGCVPITRQSGAYKHVSFRRACDRRLRRALRDWAQASLICCRWARAYYEHHKAQGHRHNTILRNLASKLVSILYRMWQTGQDYDEDRHIQSLKEQNVAWAQSL